MSTPQLMKAAAERMESAAKRLREVQEMPFTPSVLRQWLESLTDYALALGIVQELSQQSIHEKLESFARRMHLPPPARPARGS